MTLLEKLETLRLEFRSDGEHTYYHVVQEAATEIKRLQEVEDKLKIYEKVDVSVSDFGKM